MNNICEILYREKAIDVLKDSLKFLCGDDKKVIKNSIDFHIKELSKFNSIDDLKDCTVREYSLNEAKLKGFISDYEHNEINKIMPKNYHPDKNYFGDIELESFSYAIDFYYEITSHYDIPKKIVHLNVSRNRSEYAQMDLGLCAKEIIRGILIEDFSNKFNVIQIIKNKIKEYEASKQ